MQTPLRSHLGNGQIGIKDAQYAETYEKLFSDFYFWSYGKVTINCQIIEFCSNFSTLYNRIITSEV